MSRTPGAVEGPETLDTAVDLRLVVGRLNRRLRLLSASGLTASQSSMLATLGSAESLTLGELASREGISAPTTSRAVDYLVSIDLVRRQSDPDDGRRQNIVLTAKGRQTLDEAADDSTVGLSQALSRCSASDRTALARAIPALQRLVADLSRQTPN